MEIKADEAKMNPDEGWRDDMERWDETTMVR